MRSTGKIGSVGAAMVIALFAACSGSETPVSVSEATTGEFKTADWAYPPPAKEGCTPGYWKQRHHFDSWPAAYTPDMSFGSVFADAFPGMTLLDVLNQGGGGLKALGRHTVAALLNAGNDDVQSGLTTDEVISAFNAAFDSGYYETQKNIFEEHNERGCPLN